MIPLNSDDYYKFNSPFRIWLSSVKGKQLGDYKTEDAKLIFTQEFVNDWNNEKLPKEFYLKGPEMKSKDLKEPIKIISKAPRINDSFGFSKQEENKLFSHKVPKSTVQHNYPSRNAGPVDKSHLKRKMEDLDEIVPKKEGHAKVVEDRRIKSAYTRMERTHDLELSDDQLFSGSTGSSHGRPSSRSTDDYETLRRLEKEKAARREREIAERKLEKDRELQGKIEKYNQRELEVQNILKKMINNKKR